MTYEVDAVYKEVEVIGISGFVHHLQPGLVNLGPDRTGLDSPHGSTLCRLDLGQHVFELGIRFALNGRGGDFSLGADIGDMVAVGSELIRLKVAGRAIRRPLRTCGSFDEFKRQTRPRKGASSAGRRQAAAGTRSAPPGSDRAIGSPRGGAPRLEGERPLATPAVRLRAREAGIDLRQVPGTGPAGASPLTTLIRSSLTAPQRRGLLIIRRRPP